jgi:hypothetical protein
VTTLNEHHTHDPDTSRSLTRPGDVLTVAAFAPGGPRQGIPAVTGQGLQVVVLGYAADDGDQVDVHTTAGSRTLPASTPASPLVDPGRRADLLAGAIGRLADQVRQVRTELACTRARHTRTLEDVRRYAIDRHLDDEYCRDGLNAFLHTFGMPVYQPKVQVEFTITGSYQVDHADSSRAERDATSYLKLDLTELDDVIQDSDTVTITITDTTVQDT